MANPARATARSMKALDNQPEFGLSIEVSGEAKGPAFPADDYMKKYLETYMAYGGLFDQVQAARFAGVTKQTINSLVKRGRLRLVTLSVETPTGPMLIEQTIAGNDLRAWMEAPRMKGGGHLHRSKRKELQAA